MPAESNTPPNANWLAFFSEIFRLGQKLDRLEAERASEQCEVTKQNTPPPG